MLMKRLRKLKFIGSLALNIATIFAFCGFFMVIGGVGSFDFAVETGKIMSKSEEIRSYILSFSGLLVMMVSCICISKFYNYVKDIEFSIDLHRNSIRRNRKI